jgi:hypothetical protein
MRYLKISVDIFQDHNNLNLECGMLLVLNPYIAQLLCNYLAQ